jgi:hypothetical protein
MVDYLGFFKNLSFTDGYISDFSLERRRWY